ncbi:acyltransferase family protein [Aliiruegeria lutimaris]|uniref:Peptidoglycan/LPS O-acetylase OafA/YrhL, contains acyltransferase and SGNH-hydrolase domains n=1 Tax=Aliiruegeria lutimaris TaxID=571298 RepID=A0A1G9Q9R3_9RHOB|nr:acyltransferase family protein [Aliiruegeria lutimaris]SDM07822.1 Peptidoglycan/LPS O-acetylase OafA/YrhL, contains acyltransferase and SGNH-hydrolase domains [Aliiruegeria lutimaris]
MKYRHEIDGLRAIAVCAVLANHFFGAAFPNGYLGVDIFFVISGYVITGSLKGRRDQELWPFLAGFYSRRIKRLIPALSVCILVSSLLISLVNPLPASYLITGMFALVGFANVSLYADTTNYFSNAASLNPFTHTWSLGVEEQFYFVFPLIFWMGIHVLPRQIAIFIFFLMTLTSGVAWLILSNNNNMMAFYIVFYRFWEIGLGVLVYLATQQFSEKVDLSKAAKWAALLAVVGIAYAPFAIEARLATMGAVFGTAIVLLAVGQMRTKIALLEMRIPRYLGKVSYSLYLWHWPVAVMLSWTLGLSPIYGLLGLMLSIAIADLSYRWLEKPLRSAHWANSAAGELRVGLLSMAGIGGVLLINMLYLQPFLFLGERPNLIKDGIDTLVTPYQSESGAVWEGASCILATKEQIGTRIDPANCSIGAPYETANRRVLVLGNSYSAAFAAAFDGEIQTEGTTFILTSSWGASPIFQVEINGPFKELNEYYWTDIVPNLIDGLEPNDQVLLVSDLAFLVPQYQSDPDHIMIQQFEAGLLRLSESLVEKGIGLATFGPLPFAREANCEPVLAMPQWYAPVGGPCKFHSRFDTLERQKPLRTMLTDLDKEGILKLIDIFDVFCPSEVCSYLTPEGVMMFRDVYSHPSDEAAQLVRPAIQQWLAGLGE